MPKYMFAASYTPEGTKGLIADGGVVRREALTEAVASVGGTLECLYFSFGQMDAFVIADVPDDEAAAAFSLTVAATGLAHVDTILLLTPEAMDAAVKRAVTYDAPG